MPRRNRITTGGIVFHVLNRAVAGAPIFNGPWDYDAFIRILREAKERIPIRLIAFCIMPNHWHLLLWPLRDGELSQFMRLLTLTHAQRWHLAHGSSGRGALYQGRFKSFPVQDGDYFFTVSRYIERNALRAKLVTKAHEWPWSSAWHRARGDDAEALLDQGPEVLPKDWVELLNAPEFESEAAAVRESVKRGSPYGSESWRNQVASRLGLLSTLRGRGRQRRSAPLTDF